MTTMKLSQRPCSKAFTLVETVLALGIVSTVMIGLVGLMPAGMNIVREAGERSIGVQIGQKLIGEAQLVAFDEVEQLAAQGERYFDDMGTEMENDGLGRFYRAVIEVSGESIRLPGMRPSRQLKMVVVKVSGSPNDPSFSDEGAGRDFRRYTTLIVNTEDDEER